jgi:hypothetical protein
MMMIMIMMVTMMVVVVMVMMMTLMMMMTLHRYCVSGADVAALVTLEEAPARLFRRMLRLFYSTDMEAEPKTVLCPDPSPPCRALLATFGKTRYHPYPCRPQRTPFAGPEALWRWEAAVSAMGDDPGAAPHNEVRPSLGPEIESDRRRIP